MEVVSTLMKMFEENPNDKRRSILDLLKAEK